MSDARSSDDELFEQLKDAVASESLVTQRMLDAAKAAFTWRTVDAELLELSHDSSLDAALMRGVSVAAPRMLTFEGDGMTVALDVGSEVLTGQVIPAQAAHVTLVTPAGWFGKTECDDAGFFLLGRPPAGPMRLECTTAAARVVTEWVPL